ERRAAATRHDARTVPLEDHHDGCTQDAELPDVAIVNAMDRERARLLIRKSIPTLPKRLRAVAWKHFVQQRAPEQIAEDCGLTLDTVMINTRLSAAELIQFVQERFGKR